MNSVSGEVNLWIIAAILFAGMVTILLLSAWMIHLTVQTALRLVKDVFTGQKKRERTLAQEQPILTPLSTQSSPRPTPVVKKSTKIRQEYRALITRQGRQAIDIAVVSNVHRPLVPKYKYMKKRYIVIQSERQFYKRLFSVVGHEFLIFPQIHLSSLFAHNKYHQDHRAALASIQRKSVDYILCDTSLKTMCAIELDDTTHNCPERRERDEFVNHLLKVQVCRFYTSMSQTTIQMTSCDS